MESFRAALARLTRQLIEDVVEVVGAELRSAAPPPAPPKRSTVRRTVIRRTPEPVATQPAAPEARPVVVRTFEIPVGKPRTRRQRVARAPRPRSAPPPAAAAAPQPEPPVKFEVVPHPERTNRRLVLTRIG